MNNWKRKSILTPSGRKIIRAFALSCGILVGGQANAVVVDIDNAEFAKLMTSGIPVIDIRTAPEWQQTGIVPGSHLLTFFDEKGNANPGAWLDKAKSIVKPGDPVIVICRTGNRTKALSQFLSDKAGYAKVYNVRNGISAWAKDGRSLAPVLQAMITCKATNTC